MKWVTRHKVKVDRVACPWLIEKFVDPEAEFLFVPVDKVMEVAEREGAIPFDVPGVELAITKGSAPSRPYRRSTRFKTPQFIF